MFPIESSDDKSSWIMLSARRKTKLDQVGKIRSYYGCIKWILDMNIPDFWNRSDESLEESNRSTSPKQNSTSATVSRSVKDIMNKWQKIRSGAIYAHQTNRKIRVTALISTLVWKHWRWSTNILETLTLIQKHLGNFDAHLEALLKLWTWFRNINSKKQKTLEFIMHSLTLVQKQMKLIQKHPRNFDADSGTSWKVWSWLRNRWSSFRNSPRWMISKVFCCFIKTSYESLSFF